MEATTNTTNETGKQIHRRESRWQIYLPFIGGLIVLLVLILSIALPTDPIWRIRVQAMADLFRLLLCLCPVTICLFPVFMLVVFGIFGMNKLHASAATPLEKLENLASRAAEKVETYSKFVDNKTEAFSQRITPITNKMTTFDEPSVEEDVPDDRPTP